jgi:tetratricopeptide (TPR) repeat protein
VHCQPVLEADAYMLRIDESPEYWLKCLVRGDINWRSEGSTHEYLATDEEHTIENLSEIVVRHHHDGSSRPQKLERDRALLYEDLRHAPRDPRTVFYLAQTYRDLGDPERAIALYERRADMGGWEEEAFYALLQAGVLRAAAGEWPTAMASLLAAWERRPERCEPLYELASRLRARGDHHSAHLFARCGLNIPKPPDHLFVEPWIYEWGMLFEYSITAYWTGDVHGALRACDRLLDCPSLPQTYREQTVRDSQHCVRAVEIGRRPADPSFSLDDDATEVRVTLASG